MVPSDGNGRRRLVAHSSVPTHDPVRILIWSHRVGSVSSCCLVQRGSGSVARRSSRALAPELLVVGGVAVGEVEQLGIGGAVRAAAELDVLGELLGEGAEHAADNELLLDREVAAVPVGDPLEPVRDQREVVVVAGAGLDALEVRW